MLRNIGIPALGYDQHFPRLLDATSADVRCAMDAAQIAHAWGSRLLAAADLTRQQRQRVYDLSRPHRADVINRSAFGILFELAAFAPLEAAIYGPALFKVEIIGRGDYALASEEEAHAIEERANYEGNLAQLRRKERHTRSTLYDLADTMGAQAVASERLAMSAALSRS